MSNRTIEEEYNHIKAQFISLSRSIHLGYNTYDPLFTIAADAVRSVTKCEPIHNGSRRSQQENASTQMLIGYMMEHTDITRSKLAEMMQKCDHSNIYYNLKKHHNLIKTSDEYRGMYYSVESIVNNTEL